MGVRERVLFLIGERCAGDGALMVAHPMTGSKLGDLREADSLAILEIALDLEDEFDIDLVDAPITLESTVGDLVRVVEERVK